MTSHSIYSSNVPVVRFGRLSLSFMAAAALFAIGCGSSEWSYVEGVVTVGGEPVGPGIVGFKPADPTATGGGIGEFDTDGRYVVRSSGQKEGIAPGDYLVYVKGGALGETDDEAKKAQSSKIPQKYALTSTSDLRVTVAPGKQTHNFPLDP